MIDKYEEGTVELHNDITGDTVTVRCTYLKGAQEVVGFAPPSLERGWGVVEGTYVPLPEEEDPNSLYRRRTDGTA